MLIPWKCNRGFGIVEILVAVGIASVSLVSLMGLFNNYLKVCNNNKQNIEALNLAQEAMESVRAVRDDSWNNISNLTPGTIYHPVQQGTPPEWGMSSGTETINNFFLREIILAEVYRLDASGDIVLSGGVLDPDTKKVTVTVCWNTQINCNSAKYKVNLVSYITNWNQ